MQAKFAAIYTARPHMDYLECSLRSIQALGISVTLTEFARSANSVNVPEIASQGVSHVLLLNPDDVYSRESLSRILAFVESHPEASEFQVRVQTYWKSPYYRIDPPDPMARAIIFKVGASPGSVPVLIPEGVGVCHNFSFVGSGSVVAERLKTSGLAENVIARWKDTWNRWDSNRMLRNLHPEEPARYRAAVRVHPALLPEPLASHPHLEWEIADQKRVSKPSCSVVFTAKNTAADSIGPFVEKLASTVPDDCELVGCASDEKVFSALSSTPGLKAIRSDSWLAGGEAAASKKLVFVSSEVSFAGDWVEGFLAGFERNPGRVILLGHPLRGAPDWNLLLPCDRIRGRYYGQQTIVDQPFNAETASCWACTKKTLQTLDVAPCVRLEDTVVFSQAGAQEAPAHNPSHAPRATIVIPVFNNLELTKNCLDSIFAHTEEGTFELIVVDNGSTDGSWEYLKSLQPRIRCIRNRRNLFFARGCNRGGWAASANNIVFLNNDTIVKAGWLEELLRPLDRDPAVGITGNKQLFPDSHPACANRVWHAGMVIGDDKLPWHICYGFDPAHPAVNRERDCQSVSGCCIAIRRELFERLGGFDPHFQNGFEDVDLCLRARDLGYRIVYAPRSEILHYVSSSESRFDHEASNLEKFKARWSEKLVPDETGFLHESGLRRDTTAETRPRVGFISTFNQKGSLSRHAERLLEKCPGDSYVVLAEFAIRDRRQEPDAANVIRCWDRTGTWYYPLLRWATTLNLNVIHVNFDPALFPVGFLELLQALKKAGKPLVFTFHQMMESTPLLAGVAQLADAVIVEKDAYRLRLIRQGFAARTIHVISPSSSELHWAFYKELLSGSQQTYTRVRWEGPQLVNHSLALVNRELEKALFQSDEVELSITPVGKDTFATSLNSDMRILTAHYGHPLTGPVDIHVRHQWPPNWEPPAQGRWVVIQPWEYGGVPVDWLTAINRDVDEVWAPSNFVRDLYIDSGADPQRVHVVPNGVDANFFKPGARPYFLKARTWKFLFLGGTIHRKGIDILLDAYCRAFKPGDDVSLVIKDVGQSDVYRGQGIGEKIRDLQSSRPTPHIVYIDRDLTDVEMVQLYNACDCLVHPYRGEGFALPVLEAMSCGRPVIVTAGGATDDFVDDNVGIRIPARKQVFGDRCISGLKTASDLWLLEPDVEALSNALLHLYHHRAEAQEMGKRGRAKVENGWTWNHAAEKALQRVRVLKTLPVYRHLKQADSAVLLDLADDTALISTVESIKRTSYASLAIFVRASKTRELRELHPDVEVLEESFFEALHRIRHSIRAPFFALVTEPYRFSKNWFKQLAEIAGKDRGPRVAVPWIDDETAGHLDEAEFQRIARAHWRQHRGASSELQTIRQGCLVMNWECLSLATEPAQTASDWLSHLSRCGARAFLAEDTCVAPEFRASEEIRTRISPLANHVQFLPAVETDG